VCDIYYDKCQICGKKIYMHLDSHLTGRSEVAVLCWNHAHRHKEIGDRTVFWIYNPVERTLWLMRHREDEKLFTRMEVMPLVAVVSLTDNAWRNRWGNHPNGKYFPVTDLQKWGKQVRRWEKKVMKE